VLDADTPIVSGSVTTLKTFTTDRAVAADVFVVPDRNTGLALWAYVVDMGGNVYRISGVDANTSFGATAPSNWTMTKIASLGCGTAAASCWPNRKFMFSPDIIEEFGTYYIVVGSGDREKPLRAFTNTLGNTNYLFMIKDVPTSTTWLSEEIAHTGTAGGNCSSAVLCLDSLLNIPLAGATPSAGDLATKKGWYLGLNAGEQVVTSAITVFGTTTVSTHTPANPVSGSCTSNLGTARVYNINFRSAAPTGGRTNRSQEIAGGGLPPSPVAGQVRLDDGRIVPFLIGGNPTSPLESEQPVPPGTTAQPKSLTYWFIKK
jgi:type IV pilus assembly protein PilY1